MNLVKIEGCQFLCDVGFGKHTFTTPIPLEVSSFQKSLRTSLSLRLVFIPPLMDCTVWWEKREGQLTFRSGREDSGAPSAGLTLSQKGFVITNINILRMNCQEHQIQVFSDFETQCEYHQTEPTAYMAGNSIAARYLHGGELITMLGSSFRHYRFVYFQEERGLFVKEVFQTW